METPWGNAVELRAQRLPPGPSTSPEAVARNQRKRLLGAMVAAVAEHGYEATRVADLIAISGVSRSAFYKHFDDKLDCFLATVDAIAAMTAKQVSEAYSGDDPWDQRLRAAVDVFLELVTAQPAAARLCLVEIYAAGPEAIARLDGATAKVEQAVSRALEESPERAGMPRDVVRAIVGGLHKTVHTRLRRGEEQDLKRIVPELFEWGMSYRTPPEPLRRSRARAPRGGSSVPGSPEARARLLAAVVATVADHGYSKATIAEIAQRAMASLATFYAHFAGKEEAFVAAAERARRQAVDAALPELESAPDWPRGIRAGLDALFGFFAAEPAIANVSAVEVYAAGPRALTSDDAAIAEYSGYLRPGYEYAPGTTPLAAEAIVGAIHTLVYACVRKRRTARMRELTPVATFVALAPFIGPDGAVAMANARPPRR